MRDAYDTYNVFASTRLSDYGDVMIVSEFDDDYFKCHIEEYTDMGYYFDRSKGHYIETYVETETSYYTSGYSGSVSSSGDVDLTPNISSHERTVMYLFDIVFDEEVLMLSVVIFSGIRISMIVLVFVIMIWGLYGLCRQSPCSTILNDCKARKEYFENGGYEKTKELLDMINSYNINIDLYDELYRKPLLEKTKSRWE